MTPPALAQRHVARRRSAACPGTVPLFAPADDGAGTPGAVVQERAATAPPLAAPLTTPSRDVARAVTLDDVLSDAWAALTAGRSATCPVCSGDLGRRWSAGAGVVGGRCQSCGTGLE